MASTSGHRATRFAVALRGVADDESQDAARQHDLPPVVRAVGLRNGGNQEREEGADRSPARSSVCCERTRVAM